MQTAGAYMRGIVTSHAISRYRRRVEPVDNDTAIAALDTPVVRMAIAMGCCGVKLPTGQRLIIAGGRIVTILPNNKKRRRLSGIRRDLGE